MPMKTHVPTVSIQACIDDLEVAVGDLLARRDSSREVQDHQLLDRLQDQVCLVSRRLADEFLSQFAWSQHKDIEEQSAVKIALTSAIDALIPKGPYAEAVAQKLRDVEEPEEFLRNLR
jgi:hypothetical protein